MDTGKFLADCLREMIEQRGSDLHLKANSKPRIRVKGDIKVSNQPVIDEAGLRDLTRNLLNEHQQKLLQTNGGVDFGFDVPGFGRYRGNIFIQMGKTSIVFREIKSVIPSFGELHIPKVFESIASHQRGLVLVSGPTSAGKSTTVAAIVQYINKMRDCHIITLEDPIEYIYADDHAVINQRQIGDDVPTFSEALKYVVRQDPDVIVIGEMRDAESFYSAMAASETGHLVISTVHAKNVSQCFDRILGFFPGAQREQVLAQMSFNVCAITSQRLLPMKDSTGMVPVFEILVSTPTIEKLIRENRLDKMSQAIMAGKEDGMQTFNQALLDLYQRQLILKEEAFLASDNPQQLEMNMKGIFLDEKSGGILGS